jgi:hypothetical protein
MTGVKRAVRQRDGVHIAQEVGQRGNRLQASIGMLDKAMVRAPPCDGCGQEPCFAPRPDE